MIEVFIDTILVCTMTAFVILLNWDAASLHLSAPIIMVFSSFSATLGNISTALLSVSVFLFAFATIVCWGYYGKECVYFITKKRRAEQIYYGIYVIFIFVGAFISLDFVWQIADLAVGGMTLMNLMIITLMSGEVKLETEVYFIKKRASQRKL